MEPPTPSNQLTLLLNPSQIMVQGLGSLADVVAHVMSQLKEIKDKVSAQQELTAALVQNSQELVEENERLRRQIICEYQEARFRKFKQLPKEIRCMIWRFALTEPQLHPIFEDDFDRIYTGPPQRFYSKINNTMQACREARTEAVNLKFPYLCTLIYGYGSQSPIEFKNYLNFDNDTLWVDDYESEDDIDSVHHPDIYCPRCDLVMTVWPEESIYNDRPEQDACHCSSRPSLHAIAIDFGRWHLDKFKSLEDWIAIFNPRKIYFVVERPYSRSKHRLRFAKVKDGESMNSWHVNMEYRQGPFKEEVEVELVKEKMKRKRLAFIQKLSTDLLSPFAEDEDQLLISDRLKVLNEMKFPCVEFVRGIPLTV